MKKPIPYKLLSVALALLFFVVTTGFNLYIHWCSCEETVKTSLFESLGCGDSHTTSCHESTCTSPEVKIEESCGCKSEVLSIRLDNIGVDQLFTSIQLKYLSVLFQTIYIDYSCQINNNEILSNLYIPDKSPPTKPFGKHILLLNHQFKNPLEVS